MTRIIPAKFAEFSRIRYLVDPAQPDNGPIPLGVAIEVVIREQWFVGISARSALSPGEVTVLDGIARELLQNPFEFLKREVHAVLRSAQKPGDVLATLSGSKLWSVNMDAPERWRRVRILERGSTEAQIKEQMSALWFQIVYETLKLPIPRPAGRLRKTNAKHRRPLRRETRFNVLEPGRYFTQGDYWQVPLRLAHSGAQTG